jgi:hypothetical protein
MEKALSHKLAMQVDVLVRARVHVCPYMHAVHVAQTSMESRRVIAVSGCDMSALCGGGVICALSLLGTFAESKPFITQTHDVELKRSTETCTESW